MSDKKETFVERKLREKEEKFDVSEILEYIEIMKNETLLIEGIKAKKDINIREGRKFIVRLDIINKPYKYIEFENADKVSAIKIALNNLNEEEKELFTGLQVLYIED